MADFLVNFVPYVLVALAVQVAGVVLLRVFPNLLTGAILETIRHDNATALERTKADLAREAAKDIEQKKDELARASAKDIENLRAEYSSLRASTDYLAANQTELRARMIQASDTLWKKIVALRREFGGIVHLETIFLPTELADMFENGKYQSAKSAFADYEDQQQVLRKIEMAMGDDIEACRLFAGGQAWFLFYVYRATLGRVAYMTHMSVTRAKYENWRTDEPILRMLRSALPSQIVDTVLQSSLPSLQLILDQLEAHFIREATRTMVGSRTLADNISDIQATMALETMRVRENEEQRQAKP